MSNIASRLHAIAQAQCPDIVGVSIGKPQTDKAQWRVDYGPTATDQQKAAVTSAIAAFDPTAPDADDTREVTFRGDANVQAIVTQLNTATLAQIDAYVDGNATTIAGVRAVLKLILKVLVLIWRRAGS